MPDILIRNLRPEVVAQLKARAKQHHRSVQSEARLLLEQGVGVSKEEVAQTLRRWRDHFAGRGFADSSELIREDRER